VRIGHTVSNCNLPYRCVKYGDKHDLGYTTRLQENFLCELW